MAVGRRGIGGSLLAIIVSLVWSGFLDVAAQEVRLTVPDSNVDVAGDLISFDGNEYIVSVPNVGDVMIAVGGAQCSGPGCPTPVFEPGADLTLTAPDDQFSISGQLIDFVDGIYKVQTTASQMEVAANLVTCEGPGCVTYDLPQPVSAVGETGETAPERRVPDLVMVGSDNVGEDLMPLVMDDIGAVIGARLTETIELPDDIAQYVFAPDDGGAPYVIEVESTSSGPGLERLIAGTADIAMSSRQAEPDEVAAIAAQGRGNLLDVSQEYIVGVDSVVMTVHNSNPVNALSRQQLIGIYRDQITNWAEVGGPDMPITPVARDGGSARRNFERWAFGAESDLSPRTVEVDRGRDMRNFVQENPGAIGYSISDNIGDTKPIELILDCGVRTDASPFKSKAEEYQLGRRIRLYIGNDNPKPEVQQLVDLMISPEVDEEVDESGYFSLGLVPDDDGLSRLMEAALIGQPPAIGAATRDRVRSELAGAARLSLTFRFDTAKWAFDSKALRDLDRLVDYLARPENANRQFIFVGFADTRGTYEYNIGLSQNRANEVLQRVRSHPQAGALSEVAMTTLGLGEAAPVGCNDTSTGLSRNRRVEVWVR